MDGPGAHDISLAKVANSATVSVMLVDARQADHPVLFVNEAFTAMTGYSVEETVGRNPRFLQGPLTERKAVKAIGRALTAGVSHRCEILNYRKNGEAFWNNLTIDPIRDAEGEITHCVSFQHDGSSERAAVVGLINAEQQLETVIDNIPGYIFRRVMQVDKTLSYPFFSRSLFRLLDMPDGSDWSGQQFIEHMHPDDRGAFVQSAIHSGLGLLPLRSEFRMVAPSGREVWFRSDSMPREADDGRIIWEGIAVDVTAEKLSELKLTYLAHHDILTGLSNRLLFRATMIDAIAHGSAAKPDMALFCIDLDEFQVLNEELGQAFGDLVLQLVGRRLLAFAKPRGGTVARLGGDEFALLLPVMHYSRSLQPLSEAIRQELLRPETIGGREVSTEVCIGAVAYREHDDPLSIGPDERAAELMKRADLALRRAKQEGAGSCRVYSADIDDRVQNRMALRRSLQDGLSKNQFQLHYQPLVDLGTGEIVGAEALVRWNHPELGIQRPDLFIPYAESSGLIVPLGAWVLKQAMQQAQTWRQNGLATPRIAINLSSIQLQRPGFLDTVERALDETGANATDFEFELTEGTLFGAASDIHKQLDILRKLGFGLAIDDFGTGHSTLKYLRDLPVSKIKIDQTFVRQLVIDSSDALIIRAIVALSRSLRLEVVAEGIETIMQRDFLIEEGCKIGQGYLMSLPLTAEDFAWLLEGRHRLLPSETVGKRTGMGQT